MGGLGAPARADVEDFHAGVDYLGTREFVDGERVRVLGMCGSASFALSAAQVDTRIKAAETSRDGSGIFARREAPEPSVRVRSRPRSSTTSAMRRSRFSNEARSSLRSF